MSTLRVAALCMSALALAAFASGVAHAACGGKLGTSRTLEISAQRHHSIQGYEKRLGLRDKEVILTFDDGPLSNTSKVLRALSNECVKATFFVVGRHVQRSPSKVRRMAARGHTIAHHTWNHENLARSSGPAMERAVDRGIRAVNKALYGKSTGRARIPFFRYPYLAKSKRTRALLRRKGLIEIGTNIDTGDWKRQSPGQLHDRIMRQLKKKRRGIVLMHDIQPRTAAMLPRLLRSMRKAGFKVVHMAPAGAAQPTATVEVAAVEPARTSKKSRSAKRNRDVIKVSAKRTRKGVKKSLTRKARKSRRKVKRVTALRTNKKRRVSKKRRTKRSTRRVAKRNIRRMFIIK